MILLSLSCVIMPYYAILMMSCDVKMSFGIISDDVILIVSCDVMCYDVSLMMSCDVTIGLVISYFMMLFF